jgi:hypothetical protein
VRFAEFNNGRWHSRSGRNHSSGRDRPSGSRSAGCSWPSRWRFPRCHMRQIEWNGSRYGVFPSDLLERTDKLKTGAGTN